jgi:hypothetical protein
VNGSTEVITIASHGLETAARVRYDKVSEDIGLEDGEFYYVHKISANTFSLHETEGNAISDFYRVDLTASGVGNGETQSFILCVSFEDMYADDVSNGWGVVTRQGFQSRWSAWDYSDWHVYWINAVLMIGDVGATATDVTKFFGEVYCLRTMHVMDNGRLELGQNDPNWSGAGEENGERVCWFSVMDAAAGYSRAYQVTIEGSTFICWGSALRFGGAPQFIDGGDVVWRDTNVNSRQGAMQFYTDGLVFRDVAFQHIGSTRFYNATTTIEGLSLLGGMTYGTYLGTQDGESSMTFSKMEIKPTASYQILLVSWQPPGGQQADGPTHYLDDCKLYDENAGYCTTGYDVRVSHRRTFNVTVVDVAGDPIEGVVVACTNKDGDTVFSGSTNANGQLAEQKIVRRWWRWAYGETGVLANGTDVDYNPFAFTFTKDGYRVFTYPGVTLVGGTTQEINWRVMLLELTNNILGVAGVIDVGDLVGTVPGAVTATETVGDTRG